MVLVKLDVETVKNIFSITKARNLICLFDGNKKPREIVKEKGQYKIPKTSLDNNEYIYNIPIGYYSNPKVYNKLKSKYYKTDNHPLPENTDYENIKLLPEQEEIINKVLKEEKRLKNIPTSILLKLECGFGKTIVASYLTYILNGKTFIIVTAKSLIKQWIETYEKCLPNLKVLGSTEGVEILLKKKEYITADVLIFPDKHLKNLTFINFLIDNFSICFVEEAHLYNMFNNTFLSNFLTFNQINHTFALTATPKPELSLFYGSTIQLKNEENFRKKKRLVKTLYIVDSKYELKNNDKKNYELIQKCIEDEKKIIAKYKDRSKISKKDNMLIATFRTRAISLEVPRIDFITDNIIKSFKDKDNSRIIVLTTLRNEMSTVFNTLKHKLSNDKTIENIDEILFKGDVQDKILPMNQIIEKIKNLKKFIFVTTKQASGVGLDIPSLNILHITFITSNMLNIQQYAGRVERNTNEKDRAIYIYKATSIRNYENIIRKSIEIYKPLLKGFDWKVEYLSV